VKGLGKEHPPCSLKRGLYGDRYPFPEPYLAYPPGIPSQEALPPVSPHRALIERDALFPEPSFIHLSQSLVNGLLSRFPIGAPTEQEVHLQSLLCT